MSAPAIVPLVHTAPMGDERSSAARVAWVRSRHAALVDELRSVGVSNAWTAASAILAHWADETGWGHAEYGYNISNIRATAACPRAHLLQGYDDPQPRPYCDYPSLAQGVHATVLLLRAPLYAAPWSYLLATGDGPGYFDRLMRAGWHPWSEASLDSYRSELQSVDHIVGPEPRSNAPLYIAIALATAGAAWWAARR